MRVEPTAALLCGLHTVGAFVAGPGVVRLLQPCGTRACSLYGRGGCSVVPSQTLHGRRRSSTIAPMMMSRWGGPLREEQPVMERLSQSIKQRDWRQAANIAKSGLKTGLKSLLKGPIGFMLLAIPAGLLALNLTTLAAGGALLLGAMVVATALPIAATIFFLPAAFIFTAALVLPILPFALAALLPLALVTLIPLAIAWFAFSPSFTSMDAEMERRKNGMQSQRDLEEELMSLLTGQQGVRRGAKGPQAGGVIDVSASTVVEGEEKDKGGKDDVEDPVIGGYADLEEFDKRLKAADYDSLRYGRVDYWTAEEVADAAERVGLGRFRTLIVREGIDGKVVQVIEEGEVRDHLGVQAFGDVKRLFMFFRELRSRR